MTTLYVDAFGGAAGDMLLAALCDLGFDPAELVPILDALSLDRDAVRLSTVRRGALSCRKIDLRLSGQAPAHGHAHGHRPTHGRHGHDHDHGESAQHDQDAAPPHQHAGHRAYSTIRTLIEGLPYEERAKVRALRAFRLLAEAEAEVHGIDIEHVHFHEVGADDSIVDIVGVCVATHRLDIDRVAVSPLPTGHGFVECAHGKLPIPAPATLRLLQGAPTYDSGREGEQVTPTAAALLRSLADSFGERPEGVVRGVGYGAGSRDDGQAVPNALRLLLIDESDAAREAVAEPHTVMVEASVDDMNPQLFPPLSDKLVAAGAVDVCALSCLMKKGRPGWLLRLVVHPERLEAVADVLFAESTTIGLRYWRTDRIVGERTMHDVVTPFGPIAVKVTGRGGRVVNVQPEFRDCEAAAARHGAPIKRVLQAASAAAMPLWDGGNGR